MKILNLTQHTATADQIEAGVIEPEKKESIKSALTFDEIPSKRLIISAAELIAEFAADEGAEAAMIGGAPFLMSALENSLLMRGIKPLYAFSKRESVEEETADGSVVKKNIFKHVGFVGV